MPVMASLQDQFEFSSLIEIETFEQAQALQFYRQRLFLRQKSSNTANTVDVRIINQGLSRLINISQLIIYPEINGLST